MNGRLEKLRFHDIAMEACQATKGHAMNTLKHTMTFLAQIASWIT